MITDIATDMATDRDGDIKRGGRGKFLVVMSTPPPTKTFLHEINER